MPLLPKNKTGIWILSILILVCIVLFCAERIFGPVDAVSYMLSTGVHLIQLLGAIFWVQILPFSHPGIHGYLCFIFYPIFFLTLFIFIRAYCQTKNLARAARKAYIPGCLSLLLFVANFLSFSSENFEYVFLDFKAFGLPVIFVMALLYTRKWLKSAAVGLALFLMVGGGINLLQSLRSVNYEQYYNLTHFHETIYAENFSENGFEKVSIGMPKESVVQLIGSPLSREILRASSDSRLIDEEPEENSVETWHYADRGPNFEQHIFYNVSFDRRGNVVELFHEYATD